MKKITVYLDIFLIVCVLVLFFVTLFKKESTGYIYNIYDNQTRIESKCIKFDNEEYLEDFIGHRSGFFYKKTNNTCDCEE